MDRWCFGLPTPNISGIVISALIAMIGVLGLDQRSSKWLRGLTLVAMTLGAVAMALTGSRVAQVALGAALGIITLSRFLPWWVMLIPAFSVVVSVVLPSGSRWARATSDSSMGLRLDLWQGALALIQDHPWSGVGSEALDLMNRWYLPEQAQDRFATCLNEVLTIAVWWGLPIAALALGLAAALTGAAWGLARQSSRLGALAVAITVTVFMGGMTQGHLMAEYPWSQGLWCAGLTCAVAALLAANGDYQLAWRPAIVSSTAIVTMLFLVLPLGKAQWHIALPADGVQVAVPRRNASGSRTVILGFEDLPRPLRHAWLTNEAISGRTLVLLSDPSNLNSVTLNDQVVAHGGHARVVWDAWAAGRLSAAQTVLLTDPENLPSALSADQARPPLTIRYARGAPFIDRADLERRASPQVTVVQVRGAGAGWWKSKLTRVMPQP